MRKRFWAVLLGTAILAQIPVSPLSTITSSRTSLPPQDGAIEDARCTSETSEPPQLEVIELNLQPKEVSKPEILFSTDDEIRLMKVAMAEAEGEGIRGKALVMAVVYNRTQSELFPDTIEEVLYQKHQFSTITNGSYASAVPDEECRTALEAVKNGKYLYVDALFFDSCDESWASRNREYLYTIGGHNFYR